MEKVIGSCANVGMWYEAQTITNKRTIQYVAMLRPFDLKVGDKIRYKHNILLSDLKTGRGANEIRVDEYKVIGIYNYVIHCELLGHNFPIKESFKKTDYQLGVIEKVAEVGSNEC